MLGDSQHGCLRGGCKGLAVCPCRLSVVLTRVCTLMWHCCCAGATECDAMQLHQGQYSRAICACVIVLWCVLTFLYSVSCVSTPLHVRVCLLLLLCAQYLLLRSNDVFSDACLCLCTGQELSVLRCEAFVHGAGT
jgi:hypothetical protein